MSNMKNIYLDINGDILNEIIGLKSKNRIDTVLQEIVEKTDSPIISKKPEKKKETKKSKDKKKSKNKDEPVIKVVKIKRVK